MKLFIDTNVIIDVLANREPFAEASAEVLNLCESENYTGFVSTLSFSTLSYILRKTVGQNMMRQKMLELRSIITPVSLSVSVLDKALCSTIQDFEDALQFYTAVYCKADYIITRNIKDFADTSIPVMTPVEFIASI